MTRRERLQRKLEKRREWAEGRDAKAGACFKVAEPFRGDCAFNTQPGHIPERARVIAAQERGFEHSKMADHHRAKAGGLADQLDRTIFDDDPDAVERLEERIRENEAKRDRMKQVNTLYRKGDAAGLAALGLDLERLRARVASVGLSFVKAPFEGYQLSNLGATIRKDKERIETIRRKQGVAARAAEAPGGFVIEGGDYVAVTFAEKPERAILDALRAAGFTWSGGSWRGYRSKLPAEIGAAADARTTAEHRTAAYNLEREGRHREAARELRLAIEKYPPHHAASEMYASDLAALRERARVNETCQCESALCDPSRTNEHAGSEGRSGS